ncbi:uncharacterized protein LOC128182599 [Crassostrea angulata]|uniref:uncharacterized protein LOC128182599 n=1 Tax=Magallana angulata TaxID=2784310 RepID=UPI0022B09035|nr:uncharacterized protein LOC128182599 [Crassostrea angulata]
MDSDIDVSFGPKLQKDSLNSDNPLAMRGYCSLEDGSLMRPPCQNQPTRPSDIDARQCLIDPPRHQPTLSLDRPPEAEDGGSRTEPEIHSTSGLDDSCQLETTSSEEKLMFGKAIDSLDPESIYGSGSGLSGNLRKPSNLRVDSLTESNENTGTSESEDYLNDNERSSATGESSIGNFCSLDVRSLTESRNTSSEYFAGIIKSEQMMADSNSLWQTGLDYSSVDECQMLQPRIPDFVLKMFVSILSGRQVNAALLANSLYDSGIVSESCLQLLNDDQDLSDDDKINIVIKNINRNVTTLQLIYKIYNSNFSKVAQDLYANYIQFATQPKTREVTRKIVGERKKIQIYFKQIKQSVHMLVSSNIQVSELGKIMLREIKEETNPGRKRFLYDKYICLKAAEIDAKTNLTDNVDPKGEPFKEMGEAIEESSCPEISLILMLGRQADISSSLGTSPSDGEPFLVQAFQWQDICERCIESTDMMYKSVVFNLLQFQRTKDEEYRQKVLKQAKMGLESLSEEDEDVRLFWSRLFRLRIIYCHLGIGKRCEIIEGYEVTQDSIKIVQKMFKEDKLANLEHRRKMMYGIAVARFFHLQGGYQEAKDIIDLTMEFANEGKYSEKENISAYQKVLHNIDVPELVFFPDEYLFNTISPIYSRQSSRTSATSTSCSEKTSSKSQILLTSISSGEYGNITDSDGPKAAMPSTGS